MDNKENEHVGYYIVIGAGGMGKTQAMAQQLIGVKDVKAAIVPPSREPRNPSFSFEMDLTGKEAKRFREQVNRMLKATKKAQRKERKKYNRMAKECVRADRTNIIRDYVQNVLEERDAEMLCFGCELEGTFCEGARTEYQREVFWEMQRGRSEWKRLIYSVLGGRYNSLSMREKLELLKNLY